ncbi:UNVERIFIED_CONTAM: hypothetical protein Sangu_0150800 [Sesamum angustifolium]|uniref:Uncharacterized protein n=1 Tax=Sesamum angustifolium TaxID=2727405 RepID=A0AAW2RKK2_9LAMI
MQAYNRLPSSGSNSPRSPPPPPSAAPPPSTPFQTRSPPTQYPRPAPRLDPTLPTP